MARQNHTRISRTLIAAVALTMTVGGVIYVQQNHKLRAAREQVLALKAIAPGVMDLKPMPSGASAAAIHPVVLLAQGPAPIVTPLQASASPTTLPSAAPAKPAPLKPASPAASSQIIADAAAKFTAGDLLGARVLLNDALVGGQLTGASAESARRTLWQISQTVFFSKTRFKDDPYQTTYQVQSGDRLARIAERHAVTWELLCRINGLSDPRKMRSGQWLKIPNGPFHCVINKSAYRLDVYLGSPGESGSLFVGGFAVGLGKDNSTPTGAWLVQSGAKAHPATYYSPRGEGVIEANDPKNPLGGYWIGLTGVSGNALSKDSYGIHGTIEPDSIGKQASMGCIRLGHDDIALLYDLLVDGKSKVVVKD